MKKMTPLLTMQEWTMPQRQKREQQRRWWAAAQAIQLFLWHPLAMPTAQMKEMTQLAPWQRAATHSL
jgi:hypothetical protein